MRFTRREVREHTGWGNTQLKVHLAKLAELELLLVHRGHHSQRHVYELATTTDRSATGRQPVGPAERPVFTKDSKGKGKPVGANGKAQDTGRTNGSSYPQIPAAAGAVS